MKTTLASLECRLEALIVAHNNLQVRVERLENKQMRRVWLPSAALSENSLEKLIYSLSQVQMHYE